MLVRVTQVCAQLALTSVSLSLESRMRIRAKHPYDPLHFFFGQASEYSVDVVKLFSLSYALYRIRLKRQPGLNLPKTEIVRRSINLPVNQDDHALPSCQHSVIESLFA